MSIASIRICAWLDSHPRSARATLRGVASENPKYKYFSVFARLLRNPNSESSHLCAQQKIKNDPSGRFVFSGGAQEIRTPHLFHAMEALYQMS